MRLRLFRHNGEQVRQWDGDYPNPLQAAVSMYREQMGDVSGRLWVQPYWQNTATVAILNQYGHPSGYTVQVTA